MPVSFDNLIPLPEQELVVKGCGHHPAIGEHPHAIYRVCVSLKCAIETEAILYVPDLDGLIA